MVQGKVLYTSIKTEWSANFILISLIQPHKKCVAFDEGAQSIPKLSFN